MDLIKVGDLVSIDSPGHSCHGKMGVARTALVSSGPARVAIVNFYEDVGGLCKYREQHAFVERELRHQYGRLDLDTILRDKAGDRWRVYDYQEDVDYPMVLQSVVDQRTKHDHSGNYIIDRNPSEDENTELKEGDVVMVDNPGAPLHGREGVIQSVSEDGYGYVQTRYDTGTSVVAVSFSKLRRLPTANEKGRTIVRGSKVEIFGTGGTNDHKIGRVTRIYEGSGGRLSDEYEVEVPVHDGYRAIRRFFADNIRLVSDNRGGSTKEERTDEEKEKNAQLAFFSTPAGKWGGYSNG